jgi:hypothetical protein
MQSRGQKRAGSPGTTAPQTKKFKVVYDPGSREPPNEAADNEVVIETPPPPGPVALPADQPEALTTDNFHDTNAKVDSLANFCHKLSKGHDEVNTRLDTLQNDFNHRFDALIDHISRINPTAPFRPASPAYHTPADSNDLRITHGNIPKNAISNYLPHIDDSFLTEILSRELKCKDLIKLLPEEDRPRGRAVGSGLGPGFHLNAAGVFSAITEGSSAAAFEKDFPDFYTATLAMSTYGAIRDMFDQDHLGIGGAILLYIRLIARWIKVDGYEWRHVRGYFMAHFRKYQTSNNPEDWIRIDSQLFLTHIKPSSTNTQLAQHLSPSKRNTTQNSLPQSQTICNNFNQDGKGCTYHGCQRRHVCASCQQNDHAAFNCRNTRPNSRPQRP